MTDLFSAWAVVELMGRRVVVGKAEEVEMAGGKLLRVDVPEGNGQQAFSQFYGAGAIYCLSPVTEEVAMALLANERPEPWFAWKMPVQIAGPSEDGDDETDEDAEPYDKHEF